MTANTTSSLSLLLLVVLTPLLSLPAGCATAIEPSYGHVRWAQDRWPGTTLADLEAARETFLDTCTMCHLRRRPTLYEPDEWEHAILRMLEGEDYEIDETDLAQVVLYLNAASALPSKKAALDYEEAQQERDR